MKDFKRYIVSLFNVLICAVLLIGGWILWQKNESRSKKPDQFIQNKEAINRLMQNSAEIHRIWNEGEDSHEWSLIKEECLKYYKITSSFDESLLRCNPMLLQCHFMFSKKLNYHSVRPDKNNQKLYKYMTKSNSSHVGLTSPGYLFTIEDNANHEQLNLLLADSCQEVFLQNRIYAYGEELVGKEVQDAEDYRFDNFGQHIYIDRHLVTNMEVNDWIDFDSSEFSPNLAKKESNELFMPATHLLYTQMENYCSFKGKQILLAHFVDAATFLPMDLSDVFPKNNNRSPYYWTKKKNEFKPDCNLIYAEECLHSKKFQLNTTSPTWAGMMDAMGGVFEAFRNPIDPESNLKASSYYFNFKSPWHKLGFRAGWDGEAFDSRHFDFRGINPEKAVDKFQVGFRCMRESK